MMSRIFLKRAKENEKKKGYQNCVRRSALEREGTAFSRAEGRKKQEREGTASSRAEKRLNLI
jgi:hypothetical protein